MTGCEIGPQGDEAARRFGFRVIREPLRIRAGWVPDDTIKHLETFVTSRVSHNTAVLPFPTKPTGPGGSTHGGAA